MHCPQDYNYLIAREDNVSGKISYQCPRCHGKLISDLDATTDEFSKESSTSSRVGFRPIQCPRDHEVLTEQSNGSFLCQLCFSRWIHGKNEPNFPQRKQAGRLAAKIVGLFGAALVLFGWQMGEYTSKADPVSQAILSPIKEAAIIVWFLIFLFIFLIPATIYEQMVLSHRPHFRKAANHPLVRWLPAVIIGLMAINIYFLTP